MRPASVGVPDQATADGAGNKANQAERDPAIEILAKDKPGHQRSRCAFQSQKQRGRCSIGPSKSRHEQNGTNDAAGGNRCRQPWHIVPAKRLFRRHRAKSWDRSRSSAIPMPAPQ